ncbi:Major facilitator super domain-containing protein 10 [Homalodisca vitripennis]|nr:Major facilitator super domain-containing protein 10 [Homalodisca vitripennis]
MNISAAESPVWRTTLVTRALVYSAVEGLVHGMVFRQCSETSFYSTFCLHALLHQLPETPRVRLLHKSVVAVPAKKQNSEGLHTGFASANVSLLPSRDHLWLVYTYQLNPSLGSKNRCATSIWATLWMPSSGTSLTANVEILGFMGNSIGLLGSLFSFLQFVASPIVGGLSDAYGRRPVLISCLVGIACSYVLWALSHSFAVFVLARVVGGISKGNVSLSMAIITDVSTTATRGFGMALVGIAFSIGFIVGPVIGAMFARWAQTQAGHSDWFTVPAMFALSLAVIDVLFVVLCFQETLPKNKRASITQSLSQASAYISIPALFNFTAVTGLSHNDSKELTMLGLVYFVYLFLYSGLEFTITFLTHLTFGFTSMQQGYMFFCIGLVMAILQGAWVRRIPPQSTKKMAAHGLLLIVPSFLCVGLASSPLLLYIGLFLFAVSTSIVVPCMTTMASQFGTDAQKGTVMGIFRSLGALARAMGPVFASLCYWSLGSTLTYCLGGVALLWPWYTLFRSRR